RSTMLLANLAIFLRDSSTSRKYRQPMPMLIGIFMHGLAHLVRLVVAQQLASRPTNPSPRERQGG
ncbi:MAG: hypothetical protein ACK56I_12135, partial [bacterium]